MTNEVDMRDVERLPSGKYRVRVQVNGARKPFGTFPTLEAALVHRDAVWAQLATGSAVLARGMTVAQWAPSWLANHRRLVTKDKSDKGRLEKHIVASSLGAMPIDSITPRHVRDWVKELARKKTEHKWGTRPAKPLSRQTRLHVLNLLRSFLQTAVEEELILVNPAAGVKLKEAGRVVQQTWYLTPSEQAAMLNAIDGPERHIVAFAIGTGLRQGEQWNLRIADLHVEGDDPHVFVRFGSNGEPPKNGKTRKVPLFGLALQAARAWLDELHLYAPHNPLGLVFPTPLVEEDGLTGHRGYPGGGRRGKSKSPKCWAKARGAVTRLKPWWHLLRHTAASSLVAGWWGRKWSLDEVRSFMGHSSVVVTERYAHLADSALRDIAAETNAGWSHGHRSVHAVSTGARVGGVQVPGITEYARQESNLRHSASKAGVSPVITIGYEARGQAVDTARALLEKVAGNDPSWELAAGDLAATVLARRDVRLALEVAAGGPLTQAKAVQLAEVVLAGVAQVGTSKRRAGGSR